MKDFEAPRDASSSPERTSGSSKHEIYQFFHFLEPFLVEPDPDPDCESGSGSGDPLNPDPIRIRIRNTAIYLVPIRSSFFLFICFPYLSIKIF